MITYIGIGSNLDNPVAQVRSGLLAVGQSEAIQVLRSSSLYRTRPMGPQDQPDFINMVVQCRTTLSAQALLSVLQHIEHQHGRKRDGIRFGPRTLDLDILLYGDQVIESESLCIPHPGIKKRAFVLYPLNELAPDLIFPDGSTLAAQLDVVSHDGIHQLTDVEAELHA